MRISASALVRWAAVLAAVYMAGLGLWRLLEPIYMRLLAGGVATLDLVGVLPTAVQAIVVSGKGLVVMGAGIEPLAIPQRIIGADVALIAALMAATLWLPWRQRAVRLLVAFGLVFTAHLGTLLAQAWVSTTASSSVWATWNLWTTLYQGKVVPIVVWCVMVAPPFLFDAGSRLRQVSVGHVR
jgi:hypothetical protein